MPYITEVYAREVLDSRGLPTVEAEVYLESGAYGRATIPSGKSTGSNEKKELRDNDNKRYNGKGVLNAVNIINKDIAKILIGEDARDQIKIDKKLINADGTLDKSKFGANAMLAVSIAVAKAASEYSCLPLYQYLGGFSASTLPTPMINIINGGVHSDNNLDVQEFMIMPVGANTFRDAVRMGSEVFYMLKELLTKGGYNTSVGDEGGFSPKLKNTNEALTYIENAIKKAKYSVGKDFVIALDVAANSLYDEKENKYKIDGTLKTSDEMIEFYQELISKHPIISIEDGLKEDDYNGFKKLTQKLGKKIMIVGDDLFVTDSKRLEKGIKEKLGNAIIIKPNQIGTLTEMMETIELAKRNNYEIIVSHRSGETEDTFIADLSVAVNSKLIKCGSLSRTDRIAKYNQLIRIEDTLGLSSKYAGKAL